MSADKAKYFRLTKSENEIMELMWQEGRPLSRSEIIEMTPNRTWKPSSIHILLNSMLEKNAIEVAGFIQSTKNYARTFQPCVTANSYAIMQIRSSPTYCQETVPSILSALVNDVNSEDILDALEEILNNRRQELRDEAAEEQ